VGEDGRALAARHLLELILPAAAVRLGDVHLADHAIEDQVEEPVLGADVPVDDRVLGEQVAPATRRALRGSRPGLRGQLGRVAVAVSAT
jgi:hypothetical protein